ELLRHLAEDDEFADAVSRIPPGLLPPDEERRMDAWLRKQIPLDDGKVALRRGQAPHRLWDNVSVVTPRGYIVSLILSVGSSAPRSVLEFPYAFRDWFHGQGEKPETFRGKMVTSTYVSEPYSSRLEGHPLLITISVPITSEGTDQVGLLTMSLEVKHID